MEILGYILMVFVGYLFGWHAANVHVKQSTEQVKSNLPKSMNITIEVNDGELFAYDLVTNEFMAKGKTRVELENGLKTRYPNTNFMVDQEGMSRLEGHQKT